MATVNISYQGIGTSITCTQTAKTDGTWYSSALVDNQTNKYADAVFGGEIEFDTVTGGQLDIYIAASWDGVEFTGGADAGDGTITWGTTGATHVGGESDLFFVGSVTIDNSDDDALVRWGPFSVAAAVGGVMPLEWAIVFENNAGGQTDATGTNNTLKYTGIEYDSV